MKIALLVVGALLVFAAVGSAISKFKKVPDVITAMAAVGVEGNRVTYLGVLEVLGAAGLLVGIWSKPLGVLAALCLALYFVGAVLAHLRKGHGAKEFGAALGICVIAVVMTVLEFHR